MARRRPGGFNTPIVIGKRTERRRPQGRSYAEYLTGKTPTLDEHTCNDAADGDDPLDWDRPVGELDRAMKENTVLWLCLLVCALIAVRGL